MGFDAWTISEACLPLRFGTKETKGLFLARDRIGKKPLFYWLDNNGIAFASEPKSFLGDPSFSASPDLGAISHFLVYHCVPGSMSAFQGIQKLRPGHYLFIKDGRIEEKQYWKLSYANKFTGSLDDAGRRSQRQNQGSRTNSSHE